MNVSPFNGNSRSISTSLPSIRIHDPTSNHERQNPTQVHSTSRPIDSTSRGPEPMMIPNIRDYDAPPPLPPPRYVDVNSGWQSQWQNERGGFGRDSGIGSGIFGSGSSQYEDENQKRRRESNATIRRVSSGMDEKGDRFRPKDEGYASLSVTSTGHQSLPMMDSSPGLHGEKPLENAFKSSVHAYDRTLLSKLDSGKSDPLSKNLSTSQRDLRPLVTSAEASPTSKTAFESGKEQYRLKPLSLPNGIGGGPNTRWADSPEATTSPMFTTGRHGSYGRVDYRNDNGSRSSSYAESDQYLQGRVGTIRRSTSGSFFDEAASPNGRSHRGSHEQNHDVGYLHPESDYPEGEAGMKHLVLRDRSPPRSDWSPESRTGQKRRASSPPREDRTPHGSVSSSSEANERRSSGHLVAQRASLSHRMHPNNGSVSSTSSMPRNGSYTSTSGLSITASMTSLSSFDRSTECTSPTSEMDHDSPYVSSISLNPSPRGSLSRSSARPISEAKAAAPRKLSSDGGKPSSAPPLSGHFICECCPKKPKKFETMEDLQHHALEKQYHCAYCQNRFKNKNEAERHQNSLHLRRHSWSCAALTSFEPAFHPSSSPIPLPKSPSTPTSAPPAAAPSGTDTCGYCGKTFPNPANWPVRIEHLTRVHKFGECNQGKKFFRADHFRQHLKHSHAGTSGKWTNLLENACCREEECPERREPVKVVIPSRERKDVGVLEEVEEGDDE